MVVTVDEFNFKQFKKTQIQKRKPGNQGNKRGDKYLDIVTAFDIETTRLSEIEQSVMYVWQWQFGQDITVVGRTWDDLRGFISKLIVHMRKEAKLVIYVHNLSYEFQFLRGIYDFNPDEVFAISSRKVLKVTMYERLEFRCSYLHSNMSLAEYTEKMGVKHEKLSGEEFDYSKRRFPWTPLSEYELQYCVNDVQGLVEALEIEMKADDDNLYTIPLTSTGYVRRDAKAAMRKAFRGFVSSQLPTYEIYKALREAFRGGNTHANRFYADVLLENVSSADRSSSYPDVQVNCLFPVSKFQKQPDPCFDDIIRLMVKRKKALLMRLCFDNIQLRDPEWGCPYLSYNKCRAVKNPRKDNGRILRADYLETTITDIDFKIILEQYTFDNCYPLDLWSARYGPLPQQLLDVTVGYYKAKTELKGIPEQEIQYNKSKAKLNAIYGMSAQDPVKQSMLFTERHDGENPFASDDEEPEELLEKHNRHAFMCYQWGVWVTAWARYRLEEGIRLAGHNFVYCDTDSVKYLGKIDWDKYNKARIKDSTRSGAYAIDAKGETHYMGVFEYEGCYEKFKTLGAKKYAYQKQGEPLEATIAGVAKNVYKKDKTTGKKKLVKVGGGAELAKYGGFSAFEEGFVFREAGGTEAVYNDNPPMRFYDIDGGTVEIVPNVVIKESTYTLGMTEEYELLLANPTSFWI